MYLLETEHVCSAASKRGNYQQEVNVEASSTRSVPFVIIPMREGDFNIEVKVAVLDSEQGDGFRKTLHVVVRETIGSLIQVHKIQPFCVLVVFHSHWLLSSF